MALLKAVSRRAANVTLPDWTSFSRLKRHGLDSLIGYLSDAPSLPSSPSMATGAAAAEVAMEEEAASLLGGQPAGVTAPSPFSYIASRYCLTIVVITFIVNRIMNVVPPRRQFRMSGAMRLSLRLPSALLLCRALYLVAAKLPLIASNFPSMAATASEMDDAKVLWTVFLALGLQSVTECFCKALNNDLNAQASVNLLSYSYLLHFHSYPHSSPLMAPSPPVYLLIGLTVSETLALQIMEAIGAKARLFVTATFSAIGQIVMVTVLVREDLSSNALLPSLQYYHRIPEALFFALSLLTIFLHALVQLLVEHRISTSIFGHSSNLPSRNDDFSIAIIRYGTACIENTTLTGFGNEVGVLHAPPEPFVEFNRGGGSTPSYNAFPSTMTGRGFTAPEVKSVKARAGLPKGSDPLSRSPRIMSECWAYVKAVTRLYLAIMRRSVRCVAPYLRLEGRAGRNGRVGAVLRWLGVRADNEAWASNWSVRRWRDESDVDDPDFEPESSSDSEDEATEVDTARSSRAPSADPGALALVADAEEEVDAEDLHAVLLAHLSHGRSSNSPLTRRGYRAPRDADAALAETIAERRHAMSGREDDGNAEVQSLCVVCRCEMRRIVFWPCRCLAICEECKDTLASKPSPHLCVCCRRQVDGWSSAHPSSSNLERGYRDTSPSLGGPSPSKRHPPPSSPSLSSTKRRPRLLRRLGIACGCLFFGLLLLLWRLESVVVLAYFKYRDSSYDHPSPSCRLRKPPLSYIRGDDEAVVIWETTCARPGLTLRYTIEGIGGEEKEATRMEHLNVPNDSHETHHVHRAFLSNLRAGRMIDYSVRDEETSADWAKGRLKWSAGEPKPHSPIRLAFIADNQFNLRTFRQLLGEMRRFYTSKKGGRAAPDIIVHAGDAVQNAYDLAQWQTDFSDPLHNAFSFPSLAGALPPFLYTPGNHDHDRTGGHGYTGGSPTHRALSLGQSRWIVLDSNDNSTAATEWLRTELETKEWKEAGLRIVLVHVPPFIEYWQWRAWGKPQNEWKWGRHVRTDWAPLWHEAKATLVLSGHSHAYYRGLLPHTFASSFSALKSSADDAGLVSSVREAHPNAEGTIYAVAGGAGGTLDPDRVEDWGFYTTSVPGRHHWVDIELDFDAPPAETDTYVVGEETCSSVDRLTWTARALGGETIDRFAIAARRCP